MQATIRIRREILDRLKQEAAQNPREECCGLLAGHGTVITAIYPAQNTLHSPTEYEIAPQELFAIFRSIRAAGLAHLGIYHSHLTGDNYPSSRDVARAYYPEVAYFVLSAEARRPVRAFHIHQGRVEELTIEAVSS